MSLDTLIERNAQYAVHHEPRPMFPSMGTLIVSCLDARIDPAHILGLQPGEALVIRNAGGRVTEAVEQELGMLLAMVTKATGKPARPKVVLVHHTDCGMERMANPGACSAVSAASGVPAETIERLAIHDHDASLADDLARLKASPYLPIGLPVSGLRYDQQTGQATVAFTTTT